jgi:hypothetical protein
VTVFVAAVGAALVLVLVVVGVLVTRRRRGPYAAPESLPSGLYTYGGLIARVWPPRTAYGPPVVRWLHEGRREWLFIPGSLERLTEADRLTMEEAQDVAQELGMCPVCLIEGAMHADCMRLTWRSNDTEFYLLAQHKLAS